METDSLLRLPEVERRTGLRRAHLYKLARSGNFPRPIKIGARASAWRSSEIAAWIESRIAAANADVRIIP
jgi:prophage regulatory protein